MATGTIHINHNERMQFQALFDSVIEVEFLWNPPSVNANSTSEETITVPGAALGDICLISYDGDHQMTSLFAYVAAANTVDILVHNKSGGAVDLANANTHLILLKPQHRYG